MIWPTIEAYHRFAPNHISVERGQTIRFIVKNEGEHVLEFNIGTAEMHAEHHEEMVMMVEKGILEVDKIYHDKMEAMGGDHMMAQSNSNSALLESGKITEIVWKFAAGAKLEFGCNVPGHYQSGMKGDIFIHSGVIHGSCSNLLVCHDFRVAKRIHFA